MRLPLTTLEVFDAIAREGSFKGAAARLGLQPSTVSHQLKALEERLGTALIIRTTRALSLTDAGRTLLRGAGPAFEQLNDAVENARSEGGTPRGTLRLAMPEFVYKLLVGPALSPFREAYPEIELELSLTDALSDILGEEMHAGFRLGDRIAQDMVAIRLTAALPLAVLGSPEFLACHGTPEHPADLLDAPCIRYRFQTARRIARWDFQQDGRGFSVDVKGPLVVNTIPTVIDLARKGAGLVYTFRDYCKDEIATGQLVPVLERFLPDTPGIYVYFPREYRSMVPLRLFTEHLRAFARAGVNDQA
ncbi:LysR family transcriptional regulator [Pacificoceanicola onchidii]|uniref:LysR family transcriptional regulator n=1 Tax=Pacificoceanicola onchidii TaxID=2562685 RepID=UPI0010A4E1EF|nr:LysR family transcriptional regulator [Pacificoceanicola onchidii]